MFVWIDRDTFRVDRIRFAEDCDDGDGCELYYEFDNGDIRWYDVNETVCEISKKLNNLNSDKIKVG